MRFRIYFSFLKSYPQIVVSDMADTFARKTAKRKALRFRAKILALKSSLEEVHFSLNNID